jgi:hypothetical protein
MAEGGRIDRPTGGWMTRDDEKDRLGEKLHDLEKGREDKFFADRDRQLLEKLKAGSAEQKEHAVRDLAHMRCPTCGEHLVSGTHLGVAFHECPAGHGMWLAKGAVETLATRETNGWLARYLGR